VLTSNAHGSARILDINGAELVKRFKERKEVAVIAGFQGMHKETGRITTLGRGGSDTSAVAVAAAILSLGLPNYLMAATYTMVVGLIVQVALLSLYLWLRDPGVVRAILQHWRPSMLAGFLGALASQFWFLAFALATAASVRTLALVEVLFAQAISTFVFKQA